MTLVTQAVIFAAQAHDGAARKGSEIPYIVHPMEVVAIASTMTDDPQVLAAAALHDVMEDCGVTFETLSERFGVRDVVINYVDPVIGAHSGPGTMALFYMAESRN